MQQLIERKKMSNNIKTKLSNLVKDPKLEELSLSLHTPNFFTILNVTKTEIRHSNGSCKRLNAAQPNNPITQ